MNELEQDVIDGEQAIKSVRVRVKEIQQEIGELEKSLSDKKGELKELIGGPWGGGELSRLKSKLGAAKLALEQSKAPKVYWQGDPPRGNNDYRVQKITAKRIYVYAIGSVHADLYHHDGAPVSKYHSDTPKIDIEKTFPGGLECSKK